MARILLGVSAGIAAYKALELVRLATGEGHSVRVIQTPSSERFVGAASFAALSGAPVLKDQFEHDPARGVFPDQPQPSHEPLHHLSLAAGADVLLIAPASANTIARLAHGIADNLLCSCALAATCPLVLAPAMNNHMYEHPATRANLQLLRERGAHVIEPGVGRLASRGEQGVGRLPEPAQLLAACLSAIAGQAGPGSPTAGTGAWQGVRVLVTAGGTHEPIDSVRFIANRSSGRMGLALAERASAGGASVTVVAANVALARPAGVAWIDVYTAAQLKDACEREFDGCDVLLMAAAVADFRPVDPSAGKLKKEGRDGLRLQLEPTEDVLAGLAGRRRPGQTVIGFAAEHGEEALAQGRAKLARKHLDAVVVNDISRADIGFGSHSNEVTIVTSSAEHPVARAPKAQVAQAILDVVADLRAAAGHA